MTVLAAEQVDLGGGQLSGRTQLGSRPLEGRLGVLAPIRGRLEHDEPCDPLTHTAMEGLLSRSGEDAGEATTAADADPGLALEGQLERDHRGLVPAQVVFAQPQQHRGLGILRVLLEAAAQDGGRALMVVHSNELVGLEQVGQLGIRVGGKLVHGLVVAALVGQDARLEGTGRLTLPGQATALEVGPRLVHLTLFDGHLAQLARDPVLAMVRRGLLQGSPGAGGVAHPQQTPNQDAQAVPALGVGAQQQLADLDGRIEALGREVRFGQSEGRLEVARKALTQVARHLRRLEGSVLAQQGQRQGVATHATVRIPAERLAEQALRRVGFSLAEGLDALVVDLYRPLDGRLPVIARRLSRGDEEQCEEQHGTLRGAE